MHSKELLKPQRLMVLMVFEIPLKVSNFFESFHFRLLPKQKYRAMILLIHTKPI